MAEDNTSIAAYFACVRQGHVFTVRDEEGTDERWVVISQTCDIVLAKIPTITLAKVAMPPENVLPRAASGAMPRYIRLPVLGDQFFADMSSVGSRSKRELLGLPFTAGIDMGSNERQRDFSLAITRWFGRFPFPDEIVPWLRPVEEEIRRKYTRQGALGQVLNDDVVELRVETDWTVKPYALELHLIVRAESLPTIDDDAGVADPSFISKLQPADSELKPSEVAEIIVATADPLERALALQALASAFASICHPTAKDERRREVSDAVSSVAGTLWADDEFPLSRVRKSEPLDLEYLSESDG